GAALAAGADTAVGVVDAVIGLRVVFPPDLAADDEFRADVTGWLTALERHGVRATLADAR
ncbi:mannitol dehydrogenase family protein, partial [Micromonospora chalcea]